MIQIVFVMGCLCFMQNAIITHSAVSNKYYTWATRGFCMNGRKQL